MTVQDVKEIIIDPMQGVFLPPRSMEDEQVGKALQEYADALKGFTRGDLESAWRQVRNEWQPRSWPSIAAFVKAAVSAGSARRAAAKHQHGDITTPRHPHDSDGWRALYLRRWKYFRKLPIAREAAKEGWAWSAKCAILDGYDLSDHTFYALRRAHNRAEYLRRLLETDETFHDRELALRMHDNLRVKEAETAAEIELRPGNEPLPEDVGFANPYPPISLNEPSRRLMDTYYKGAF